MSRALSIRWCEVEADRLRHIWTCFCFGVTCRRASRQFRTHRGIALCPGIVIEHHTELHRTSIGRVNRGSVVRMPVEKW